MTTHSENPKTSKRKRSKLAEDVDEPADNANRDATTTKHKKKKKAGSKDGLLTVPTDDVENAPEQAAVDGEREAKKLAKEERKRRKLEKAEDLQAGDGGSIVEEVAADVDGAERKKKKKRKRDREDGAEGLAIPQPLEDAMLSEQGKKGMFSQSHTHQVSLISIFSL